MWFTDSCTVASDESRTVLSGSVHLTFVLRVAVNTSRKDVYNFDSTEEETNVFLILFLSKKTEICSLI